MTLQLPESPRRSPPGNGACSMNALEQDWLDAEVDRAEETLRVVDELTTVLDGVDDVFLGGAHVPGEAAHRNHLHPKASRLDASQFFLFPQMLHAEIGEVDVETFTRSALIADGVATFTADRDSRGNLQSRFVTNVSSRYTSGPSSHPPS